MLLCMMHLYIFERPKTGLKYGPWLKLLWVASSEQNIHRLSITFPYCGYKETWLGRKINPFRTIYLSHQGPRQGWIKNDMVNKNKSDQDSNHSSFDYPKTIRLTRSLHLPQRCRPIEYLKPTAWMTHTYFAFLCVFLGVLSCPHPAFLFPSSDKRSFS